MDILSLAMVNLVFPATATGKALKVAEPLRQHLATSTANAVPSLKLTISIGVSNLVSGQKCHQWVAQANLALYRAKQQGPNQSWQFRAANDD